MTAHNRSLCLRDKILSVYSPRMTRGELSAALGIPRYKVNYHLAEMGLTARHSLKLDREPIVIALRAAHEAGRTASSAAAEVGCSVAMAAKVAREIGLNFPKGLPPKKQDARADQMAAMFKAGYTLEKIGQQYGLTRERVRQLVKKYHGMVGKDGGQTAASRASREKRRRADDMKCFAKHGCSREQYRALQATRGKTSGRSPVGAFIQQRNNAHRRGIEWRLKLWEWWTIWQESGHWEQRGRGQGYVMSRLNDQGSYAAGNVYVTTAVDNICEAAERWKKSGLPRGVYKRSGGYIARRQVNGHKFESPAFPSPELAHVAYLSAGVAA